MFWSWWKELKPSKFACRAGGRGVVVGPILSQSRSDVFCDNENGVNFLFKNNGDGKFADVARQAGGRGKMKAYSLWSGVVF